ncbi:MAG: cytochrome c family protein [Betaproteobacteria bacterium]|nr:cytochrome c family protein [Betaproteobacteria bacterium]
MKAKRSSNLGYSSLAMVGMAAGVLAAAMPSTAAETAGDAKRGAKVFQACVACHSAEPGRHMTGPSLAQLFGRKAGTAKGFLRYSDPMLKSDIVWDERALDQWLASPAQMIPGNDMAFPGLPDQRARRDLIAYLRAVAEGSEAPRGPRMPRLKSAQADDVVKAIRYCGDTYFVTTEAGKTLKIWEFNLRLKTDSTEFGPRPGRPVLVGVGMGSDRAAIVFSAPGEIAKLIKAAC